MVVVLEFAENYFEAIEFSSNESVGGSWGFRIWLIFRQFLLQEVRSSTELFATIAGISGVFLGLYFAAISVVAGSLFANVSSVIRNQVVREKAGNVYIKALALLCLTSILLLSYQTIGFSPGVLNLCYVVLLSTFGVLSFLLLGRRVFNFFDYSELAGPIIADIYTDIRNATVRTIGWRDESFQAFFQKRASENIRSLGVFVNLTRQARVKEEVPLVNILQNVIHLLADYQKKKREIPSRSKWFKERPNYRNWFLADSPELSVAMNAHVGLSPKMEPNKNWFEEETCAILEKALAGLLSESQVDTAYRAFERLTILLQVYGKELALEESEKTINILRQQTPAFVEKLDAQVANRLKGDDFNLAFVDLYSRCMLSFVLGFFERIAEDSLHNLGERLTNIRNGWTKASIYKHGFPANMSETLEHIQKVLAFEKKVEGRFISPAWYTDQLTISKYAELLFQGLEAIVAAIDKDLLPIADLYLSKEKICVCRNSWTTGIGNM